MPRLKRRSFGGGHLDRAGLGAAEAVRPIHVLDHRLRQHIASGRHRPHDIGDRVGGRIAASPLECRREAIVAELGIGRRTRILDPVEGAGIAGRHEPRIVDLEPRRHIVGQRHARELRLRLGHRQQHDEAVVLLRRGSHRPPRR